MKQMLIHAEGELLQAAVLRDGVLVDFHMERSGIQSLVGNVYKGRVVNVLPGMGAAFVDIGLSKNAFLYIDDLLHPHADKQPKQKPSIEKAAWPGMELTLQVAKDPIGSKGAKVTTHFNMAGRFLVYMPRADYVGVSKKIEDDAERERLRELGEKLRRGEEGIIMRTAAVQQCEHALGADVAALRELWLTVEGRAAEAVAPALLHSEAGLLHRALRDLPIREMDEIWIDHAGKHKEVDALLADADPGLAGRLKLYEDRADTSLFRHFGVDGQIETAFSKKIPMQCGGYLIWEETEALTVIDVNTGRFTGSDNLEDTVFQANWEAAGLISRLLHVRDVGGIVIIDYIDMEREESREKILARMVEEASRGGTKCTIVGWTRLGLMELTRKKIRKNAARHVQERCPVCEGTGIRGGSAPQRLQ